MDEQAHIGTANVADSRHFVGMNKTNPVADPRLTDDIVDDVAFVSNTAFRKR